MTHRTLTGAIPFASSQRVARRRFLFGSNLRRRRLTQRSLVWRHLPQRLFGDSDPSGEVKDLRNRKKEDAGHDGNNPDQPHVPAVAARKTSADACELTAVEWARQPRPV